MGLIAASWPRSLGEPQPQPRDDDDDADSDGNRQGTGLQFITITHPSQIHTRNNQLYVRSSAMRSFRQKQRQSFAEPLGRSALARLRPRLAHITGGGAQAQAEAGAGAGSVFQQCGAAPDSLYGLLIPRPQSNSENGRDENKAEYRRYALTGHGSEGSQMPSDFRSHKESPAWILGAGRMDPFMTSPIKHYPYIDEVIDHCKRLLVACSWPNKISLRYLCSELTVVLFVQC